MYVCQTYQELNGQIEDTSFFKTIEECMIFAKRNARIIKSYNNGWDTRINVAIYQINLETPLKIVFP